MNKHNDRIYLNPRIDTDSKKEFERNLFELKQSGIRLDMSKLFRAFVDKFNEDPADMVKHLNINK